MAGIVGSGLDRRGELQAGAPLLLGGFLGVLFSFGTVFLYSYSMLMPFLEAEYHWTRLQLSLPPMLVALCSALLSPLAGRLVDRFGVLRVSPPSMAMYGVGLLAMGYFHGDVGLFLAAIVGIAILAAGTNLVSYVSLVSRSFDKARGMAIGITMAATGLSGAIVTRVTLAMAQWQGWRGAYLALGLILLAATPVIALLLARGSRKMTRSVRAADRIGADVNADASGSGCASQETSGWTLALAVRHHVFRKMFLAMVLMALATTGLIPHFVEILRSIDISLGAAASIAGMIGLAVVAGRLTAGFMIDRLHAPYVGATCAAIAAVAVFLIALKLASLAWLSAVMLGFALGAEIDVAGYVVARYYGTRSYGIIYGSAITGYSFGGIASPVVIGFLYDRTGSYSAGLFGSAALLLLTLPLFASMGPYPDRQQDAD